MKFNSRLIIVFLFAMFISFGTAQALQLIDSFSYADGALPTVSAGKWLTNTFPRSDVVVTENKVSIGENNWTVIQTGHQYNWDYKFNFTTNQITTNNFFFCGGMDQGKLCYSDGNSNQSGIGMQIAAGSASFYSDGDQINASALTLQLSKNYWVRFQFNDSNDNTAKIRVWGVNEVEPTKWNKTYNFKSDTDPQTIGRIGAFLHFGGTGTDEQDYLDDLYNYSTAGAGGSNINISNFQPLTNTQFNTALLNINFTVDSGENYNCSLYVNGVYNYSVYNKPAGLLRNLTMNLTFGATSEVNYTIKVSCNYSTNVYTTTGNNVYIDRKNPWAYFFNPFAYDAYGTIINNSFYARIIVNDSNLYSYRMNYSKYSSTATNPAFYSWYNNSLTGLQNYTIDTFVNLSNYTGKISQQVTVCDGHTDSEINFEKVTKSNNELNFDGVKVYLNTKTDTAEYSYEKLTDRYSFSFKTKSNTNSKQFVVESPNYIDIVGPKSSYKGHLITQDKWIDFEGPFVDLVEISRISDTKVLVTVYSKVGTTDWNFNSIGELNCITYSTLFFSRTVNEVYDSQVLTLQNSTFILNLTYDNNNEYSYGNVTLHYNGAPYTAYYQNQSGVMVYNYTLKVPSVTTITDLDFWWTYNYWNHTDNVVLNTSRHLQTIYPVSLFNCTDGTGNVTLNITLRNETSNLPVNGSANIYIKVYPTSGSYFVNFTFSFPNYANYLICKYPGWGNFTSEVEIGYTAPNYDDKTYYLYDYILGDFGLVNLLLSSGTTQVQLNVVDQYYNPVPNVFIKVLKYDIGTNAYLLTEVVKTDSNGVAYAQLILNTEWYKFILVYDSKIVLETTSTKIITTSKDFKIYIGADYYKNYNIVDSIACDVTFTNATKTFAFTYTDDSNTIQQGCLKLIKNSINSDITVNETCVISATSTILSPINGPVSTNSYTALGYFITDDGDELICKSTTHNFNELYKTYGKSGIFATFLITLTLIMVGLWSPAASIILMLLGIIASVVMGLFYLSIEMVIALVIIVGITLYRMKSN